MNRFSFEFRLAALVVISVVASVAVFGTLAIGWTRDALVAAEVEELDALADARVDQLETLAASYEREIALTASRAHLRALTARYGEAPAVELSDEISAHLVEISSVTEATSSLAVIGADRRVIAATDQALVGRETTELNESFGIVPAINEPIELQARARSGGVDLVGFGPINLDGTPVGTIQIAFSTRELASAVSIGAFGETGEIVVGYHDEVDDVARFVTPNGSSTDRASTVLAPMSAQEVPMVRALRGETVAMLHGAVDYDGNPVVAVTRQVPSFGWGLVAKKDSQEITDQTDVVRNSLVLLGVLLALVGLAGSLVVHRRIRSELIPRQRAETRFTSLFTSSPVGLMLVGADGSIQVANGRLADLLGYDIEGLESRNVDDLIPAQYRPEHVELRQRYVSDDGNQDITRMQDVVALTADGREIPVQVDLTPVRDGDDVLVIASLMDLTDRRQAAAELEARAEELVAMNEQLGALNEELDQFASAAAHDLRSPLRAMHQLSEFVIEDAGDALPEQSLEDLKTIQQRSLRLSAMIEGLLEYAQIGQSQARPSWVDTETLIDELADLYVPEERFTLDRPEPLPPVFGPRAAVELVFRNLLMNVVKHHDRVEGRIELTYGRDGSDLVFQVRDDGPGIPDEYADQVFRLFKTLEPRDKREASGLGLTLVRKTAEVHGGSVRLVDPSPDRGAVFEVRWPIPSEPPWSEPSDANTPPSEVHHA